LIISYQEVYVVRRGLALVVAASTSLLVAACTTTVIPVQVVTVTAPPPTEKVLDGPSLNSGVRNVLEDDYKIMVDEVTCPNDEQPIVGNSFTCTAVIDGQQKQVTITVKTADGKYEVGQPR
jgi:hypothetical protein